MVKQDGWCASAALRMFEREGQQAINELRDHITMMSREGYVPLVNFEVGARCIVPLQ
ncbi:MAG: hypothetical protein H7175_15140 [Burkholderiales bacterium]|nr:hypothetical protein [Anaerolineae bacterium]